MAGWNWRPHKDNARRVSRPVGCLLWLVVLLLVLIVAAVLFGGFQTGTKVNGSPEGAGSQVSLVKVLSVPTAAAT
jgi:hypothetical protein